MHDVSRRTFLSAALRTGADSLVTLGAVPLWGQSADSLSQPAATLTRMYAGCISRWVSRPD